MAKASVVGGQLAAPKVALPPPVMPAPPPSHDRAAIVARLRVAGCVFAEDEAELLVEAAVTPAELDDMVRRRVAGLPLEHLLGWAQFCGVRVGVDPGVFVPRRRTELLVDEGADLVPAAVAGGGSTLVVVDLCCGSGAVGLALATVLATVLDRVDVHAVDIDPAAVRCASRNLLAVGGTAYEGDLYQPLPDSLRGRIDLLVANAPYVPTDAIAMMPPEARLHEARVALDGGPDGLDVQRRVIAGAPRWLRPAGHLLVETSEGQVPLTLEAFADAGLVPRVVTSAELEATVVVGSMAADRP
jgi:release factor glutamine methyltransferase